MSVAEVAAIEISGAEVMAEICDAATAVAFALAAVALGANVAATATPAASLPADGGLRAFAGIDELAEEVSWLDAVGVAAVAAPISFCICEKNWIA
jgi:hypothetical protein